LYVSGRPCRPDSHRRRRDRSCHLDLVGGVRRYAARASSDGRSLTRSV
jgi:hypothetical protein